MEPQFSNPDGPDRGVTERSGRSAAKAGEKASPGCPPQHPPGDDQSPARAGEAGIEALESDQGVQALLSHLPGMVYRRAPNLDQPFEFVSDGCRQLTGYSPESLMAKGGVSYRDLIHPEDRERVQATIAAAVAQGAAFDLNYRINTQAGGEKWVGERGSVAVSKCSSRAVCEGFITDISLRKAEEEMRRMDEARYRSIFENIQDVYYECDKDGTILEVSPSVERALLFQRQDLLGQKVLALYADLSERERLIVELDQRGLVEDFEVRLRRKDGTIATCALTARLRARGPGQTPTICGSLRNVTERKLAEQELRESQERFAKVFRSNPAPMVISEITTGHLIDANEQFFRMLGLAREESLGRTTVELGMWNNPSARDRMIADLLEHGSLRDMPIEFRAKDGKTRSTLCSAERITLGGRETMLTLLHDYTERKQAESEQKRLQAQLVQAQKMEAIGQLAGGVAHDFNNILTAILMHLSLIQMDEKLLPELRTSLQDLDAEAHRAAALTRQLLMFSRQEVMRTQLFDLNSLLGNLLKMLRRLIGEQIRLELAPAAGPLWLDADPGMVEQIVMNLVLNARDALPDGGRIILAAEPVSLDDSAAQRNPEARAGRFARLMVSDTGCGMSVATMKHMFEPFFTTKAAGKGTGLGLATVYGITKQHQGWVEVVSAPGAGSTFTIYFPAPEKITQPAAEATHRPAAPGGSESILLVEDDPSVLMGEARILRELGYEVLTATNAAEALLLWESSKERIHLLISDLVLPGPATGLELAETLLQQKDELKAILVSGYNTESTRAAATAPNRVQFLAKPLTAPHLAKSVRDLLDSPESFLSS